MQPIKGEREEISSKNQMYAQTVMKDKNSNIHKIEPNGKLTTRMKKKRNAINEKGDIEFYT